MGGRSDETTVHYAYKQVTIGWQISRLALTRVTVPINALCALVRRK